MTRVPLKHKRVRITMGFDSWDPILLPVNDYGDLYEVDADALDRFEGSSQGVRRCLRGTAQVRLQGPRQATWSTLVNKDKLYRIVFPGNGPVCGIVLRDGRVVEAAPVVRWLMGRTVAEFRAQARARGWQVEALSEGGTT